MPYNEIDFLISLKTCLAYLEVGKIKYLMVLTGNMHVNKFLSQTFK